MNQCSDKAIQRYYQLLTTYMAMTKQIENCAKEDREFYQDVCISFAEKMKVVQTELADQGFVLCQGNRPSPCENSKGK